MKKLLIANRGEIAIRISRAAAEMGIHTVAVYPEDDSRSLHVLQAQESICIPGTGARAYLDQQAILDAAARSGADAVHPGYGFLSENVSFARSCEDAGILFVGPSPDQLAQFGNKAGARQFAASCKVPLVPGTNDDTSLEEAVTFFEQLNGHQSMLIKAISGGGGRGMRVVETRQDLEKLYDRCRSEAGMAFGNEAVYVEALIPRVRHIEIQVIGDGTGNVMHLWERECSVQRQNQKLVEIAPSPTLPESTRKKLIDAAVKMARKAGFRSLGTFEFLVELENPEHFYFIETNPRLQVEHTVTEEITGIDLVQLQLDIAQGGKLDGASPPAPKGFAIQCRINMETPSGKGGFKPTGGILSVFESPGGPGIRVDGAGYAGYETSTRYDSLLAKLIVHAPGEEFTLAADKVRRALGEFRIEGFPVNIPFLINLVSHESFRHNTIDTRFVDDHL